MTRAQKGKHHKRKKSWHRGVWVGKREAARPLPDVGSGADPTASPPTPVVYGPGKRVRDEGYRL